MKTSDEYTGPVTVVLLWGLPGSGKTHWCKEAYPVNPRTGLHDTTKAVVTNLDNILRSRDKYPNPFQLMADRVIGTLGSNKLFRSKEKSLVIDGLFTTNALADQLFTAITTYRDRAAYLGDREIKFRVILWKEDREACRHNDLGRRKKDSVLAIDHSTFEEPSAEFLAKWGMTRNDVAIKTVYRKPQIEVWMDETVSGHEKGVLKSDNWCLGGSSRNCYGDRSYLSVDVPPASFDDLDSLLETIAPDLTMLEYKRIERECVKIVSFEESDYYTDGTYAAYQCDLAALHALLGTFGKIKIKSAPQ